jgi:hypothetical protein
MSTRHEGIHWLALTLSISACGSASAGDGKEGGGGAGWGTGGTGDPAIDCVASPITIVIYETAAQLNELLVRRWQRCTPPMFPGEDVGVEFAADGRWYPLRRDDSGAVVRALGIDFGGTWSYGPPGSMDPVSHEPSRYGFFVTNTINNTVVTSPPGFADDPPQLRIPFMPDSRLYIPLDR